MGRRDPKTSIGETQEEHFARFRKAMLNNAGPMINAIPDKESSYISEAIEALTKIDERECSKEVMETVQAAIETLKQCL